MKTLILFLLVICLSFVSAATVSYEDTIYLDATNFSDVIAVQKFDDNGGQYILESITFNVWGHVEGSIKFESQDGSSATVETSLAAMLQLKRPDDSLIMTSLPSANNIDNVTAFDGTLDFAGTSGKTYADLENDVFDTWQSFQSRDTDIFRGVGNISLPVVAMGVSSGNGAGNLTLQFQTLASARVQVVYNYSENNPNIPEPSVFVLFTLAIIAYFKFRK